MNLLVARVETILLPPTIRFGGIRQIISAGCMVFFCMEVLYYHGHRALRIQNLRANTRSNHNGKFGRYVTDVPRYDHLP